MEVRKFILNAFSEFNPFSNLWSLIRPCCVQAVKVSYFFNFSAPLDGVRALVNQMICPPWLKIYLQLKIALSKYGNHRKLKNDFKTIVLNNVVKQ